MTFGFPAYHEEEYCEDIGREVNLRGAVREVLSELGWTIDSETDKKWIASASSLLTGSARFIVQFRHNGSLRLRSEWRWFLQYKDYGIHESNVMQFIAILRTRTQRQVIATRLHGPGTNEYAMKKIATEMADGARRMGVHGDLLPSVGRSRGFGIPHIEVNIPTLHFMVVDHRSEVQRRSTQDYQEFLYWVYTDLARRAAESFEREHRIPDQDVRRLQFSKELELLNLLDPQVAARRKKELDRLVLFYPYRDVPRRS